jgi:hypothetical protein
LQKKFGEAEKLFRSSLALHESLLGTDHPLLVPILENYGAVLRMRRRDAEAGNFLDRAKGIRQRESMPR